MYERTTSSCEKPGSTLYYYSVFVNFDIIKIKINHCVVIREAVTKHSRGAVGSPGVRCGGNNSLDNLLVP